ncbi:hypothetical protein BC834DRAFT_813122, partial [Gloeopeniophorella convolvens]
LLAIFFSMPTLTSPDGPLAQFPTPTTQPLRKAVPRREMRHSHYTRTASVWEKSVRAMKSVHPWRCERNVWDGERQERVVRWGRNGANIDAETE